MSGLKHWCSDRNKCKVCNSKEDKRGLNMDNYIVLGKRNIQVTNQDILLIDSLNGISEKCSCKNNASYLFVIHGNFIFLCEECLAKIGKTVIDGLL